MWARELSVLVVAREKKKANDVHMELRIPFSTRFHASVNLEPSLHFFNFV